MSHRPQGFVTKPLIKLGAQPGDCWAWLGKHTGLGHPQKTDHGKDGSARRWLWTQLFGPLPDELKITTTCSNLGCMNPQHWAICTQADAIRKGSKTVLLPGDVAEIRRAKKGATVHTIRVLMERYGITDNPIRAIWGGKTWKLARGPTALAAAYTAIPKGGLTAAARAAQASGHSQAAP